MTDSKARSLLKTITWRLVGSASTMVIAQLISGDWKKAGAIASIQLFANTVLYYGHERLWSKVWWGGK